MQTEITRRTLLRAAAAAAVVSAAPSIVTQAVAATPTHTLTATAAGQPWRFVVNPLFYGDGDCFSCAICPGHVDATKLRAAFAERIAEDVDCWEYIDDAPDAAFCETAEVRHVWAVWQEDRATEHPDADDDTEEVTLDVGPDGMSRLGETDRQFIAWVDPGTPGAFPVTVLSQRES